MSVVLVELLFNVETKLNEMKKMIVQAFTSNSLRNRNLKIILYLYFLFLTTIFIYPNTYK